MMKVKALSRSCSKVEFQNELNLSDNLATLTPTAEVINCFRKPRPEWSSPRTRKIHYDNRECDTTMKFVILASRGVGYYDENPLRQKL